MPQIEDIAKKLGILGPHLDERTRRLWAATEALSLGRGGITAVSAATGMSRTTIRTGIAEIKSGEAAEVDGRVRKPGGGRKRLEVLAPGLQAALDAIIDPVTRGDPESPLRWTSKSLRQLAEVLTRQGFTVSPQKIAEMLHGSGYSLQATQKTLEGASHPDRDAQFHYIAAKASALAGVDPGLLRKTDPS